MNRYRKKASDKSILDKFCIFCCIVDLTVEAGSFHSVEVWSGGCTTGFVEPVVGNVVFAMDYFAGNLVAEAKHIVAVGFGVVESDSSVGSVDSS